MIIKVSFLRAVNSDDCKAKQNISFSIYVFVFVFSQLFIKYFTFILSFEKIRIECTEKNLISCCQHYLCISPLLVTMPQGGLLFSGLATKCTSLGVFEFSFKYKSNQEALGTFFNVCLWKHLYCMTRPLYLGLPKQILISDKNKEIAKINME